MYSHGSSPSLGGRSPKLPGSFKSNNLQSNFSPSNRSGKVGSMDPVAEMERLERDLIKVTQVCK